MAEARALEDEYKKDKDGNLGAAGLRAEASLLLESLFENSNRHGLRERARAAWQRPGAWDAAFEPAEGAARDDALGCS